jgi:PAS domain S-box-containing protein/putative nucleotidyltransferase with HDIG domain
LAQVGFAEHDEKKTVCPVAHAGYDKGYLDTLNITWADTERGRSPTGRAIRTGKHFIYRNILTDPDYALWRDEAARLGYASSIALPLIANGQTFGALNIYAAEPDAFDAQEVDLLMQLSADMAYDIMALRMLMERKRMEESLKLYREIFYHSKDGIAFINPQGFYLEQNPAHATLIGYSDEDLNGKTPAIHLGDETFSNIAEELTKKGFYHGEVTSYAKLGKKDIELSAFAITNKNGEVICYASIKRDITERKQHQSEIEAIVVVATALRSATNRADMLPVILDQLLNLLKAEGAALAMRDPVSGETLIELARGSWSNWTGVRLQPGEGVSGHVIETSQTYLNNDVRSDLRIARPDLIKDISAMACVPLIAQGQTIGALLIGRKTDIANDEVRLITAIGNIAANAIQRATLHEQTERRMQRFSALHMIDMAISASLDLRLTLNVLLEQVTTQLRVDAATLLLLNPNTLNLEYAASRGFRTSALQHTYLRMGEGHAGRAALERRIVSIPNLAETLDSLSRSPLLANEGFISYYAVLLIAKGNVKGVLEILHRAILDPDQEWLDFLETLATQAAIAIDNASLFDDLQRSNVELILAYDSTLEGWSKALDLRDKETEGHSQRVTDMTLKIARVMGISDTELVHVRRGALLHDIGKMGVPDNILLKPGPLNDEEWKIMRKHSVYASELLSTIAFLRPALDIPYYHHEKWDGTGYPRGLKGEQIPLAARIFAVVDVWDALHSDRPYRPAWPEEKVREYLQDQAGKHFDPKVVEAFLSVIA